jgi:hypothetical protein
VKGSGIPSTNEKGRLELNPVAVIGIFGLCVSVAATKGASVFAIHTAVMKESEYLDVCHEHMD